MTNSCQRWVERRDRYRPAGEVIDPRRYEVAAIDEDRVAKAFVAQHHYSANYPAARWRFGLYRAGALVGTCIFSVPANPLTLKDVPGGTDRACEIGRFVLTDDVPGNGESWFLTRCFEAVLAKGDVQGVVMFSDPFPRQRADGTLVFPGHIGTIYQAVNATYLGRSKPDTLRLLPDGRAISNRTLAKIRKRDRGWRYAAAVLTQYGAAPLGEDEDARAWLVAWLPRLTRAIRHPGNHKYAWVLPRALRRRCSLRGLPYPKKPAQEIAAAVAGDEP